MTGTGTQADPYIVDNFPDFITAVGTSGAYVEFPKNLVKTSDTEIVEGKLYVDGSGEPVTNPVTENLGNYYENTFALNANDYAPEGMTARITIACAYFHGRGGAVKNIWFNRADGFYITANTDIRATAFLNWRVTTATNSSFIVFNSNNTYTCYFRKNIFQFGVEETSGGINLFDYIRPVAVSNSFYVRSASTGEIKIFGNNSNYTACTRNRVYVDTTTAYRLYMYYHDSLLVQGNCRGFQDARITNSVIDATFSGSVNGSNNSKVLVNKDKASSISGEHIAVTTEQLTDAAYLSSIGFPIQT